MPILIQGSIVFAMLSFMAAAFFALVSVIFGFCGVVQFAKVFKGWAKTFCYMLLFFTATGIIGALLWGLTP